MTRAEQIASDTSGDTGAVDGPADAIRPRRVGKQTISRRMQRNRTDCRGVTESDADRQLPSHPRSSRTQPNTVDDNSRKAVLKQLTDTGLSKNRRDDGTTTGQDEASSRSWRPYPRPNDATGRTTGQ